MRPTSDVLKRLYQDELKSLREIGVLYGVHATQVRRWLVQDSIPTRSLSESTKLGMRKVTQTEAHKEKLRENLEKARAARTPESHRKRAEKMKGREPWNKGRPWTEADRAAHAYRQTEEYSRKMSASQGHGEESHAWRGGHESRSPRGIEWLLRRRECYERDGWICQDCGRRCKNLKDANSDEGSRIQAHHIVPRRLGGNDDLSNLVTLCARCHGLRERAGDGRLIL